MSKGILKLIAAETAGESYQANKIKLEVETDFASRIDNQESRLENPKIGETEKYNTYVPLKNLVREIAKTNSIFTYFLDGSRHVYKVDEIAYRHGGARKMVYPVVAGQVAVGCCLRQNKKLHAENFLSEIILTLPDIANANGSSGFFPALTQKINALPKLKIELSKILEYSTSQPQTKESKLEDRAVAKIQDSMYQAEQNMVAALVSQNKLNQKSYLIKDGSLEYRIPQEISKNSRRFLTFKNNFSYVIGLSKKFNPALFTNNGGANPGFIAELPLYCRTPVIRFENDTLHGDIKFAVWYVRIRDRKFTESPFDGVLKVEKMLVTREEIATGKIESDLVNFLSAHIINERNPVCYGADNRWANHIYPIFLTETFVKSKCIEAETFLNLF
ncbi:MAG: hypothetical protein IJT73_07020 [Selenomonadaceae bacterium]|nr:hypothetical protein [Selenomonadaceae bacterium]